jgi:TATA-binding protein interacting (TIP20).
METAFSRVSIVDLYERIIAGLSDDNDIRALCNLMIAKLVYIDPDETARRLDAIAEGFRKTLSHKLKDNAVKQEIEKQDEAIKSVLRLTLLLSDKLKSPVLGGAGANASGGAGGAGQVWLSYLEWVNDDFAGHLKALRDETKEFSGPRV